MSRYNYGFGCNQVGNGILFIIAIFFLSCAGCGTGSCGPVGCGTGSWGGNLGGGYSGCCCRRCCCSCC